jgi:hypothetical protein
MSKTIKCWGIPYGLKDPKKTEAMTIQSYHNSIEEFEEYCKNEGHKLIEKPYFFWINRNDTISETDK